jgi:hypothetical protein
LLGVTLFGIFLTPVFFYVIRRFSRVPSAPVTGSETRASEHRARRRSGKLGEAEVAAEYR